QFIGLRLGRPKGSKLPAQIGCDCPKRFGCCVLQRSGRRQDFCNRMLKLEAVLVLFSSRYVARDTCKKALTIFLKFTERNLQLKLPATLVHTWKFDRVPRDVFVPGRYVIPQTSAMKMPEVFRHQDSQFGPDQFFRGVTENRRGRAVNKKNCAVFVDGNDCVGGSLGDDA